MHIHLELKSQQRALPQQVFEVLGQCGWLQRECEGVESPQQAFCCPGLTVTSFLIDQLTASKKVGDSWIF